MPAHSEGFWVSTTCIALMGALLLLSCRPSTFAPLPVASVILTSHVDTLAPGSTKQLNATVRDAAGTTLEGRGISWSTSNPAVATVSQSGLVTSVAEGSADITATAQFKTATSTITVEIPVAAVAVTPVTPTLGRGETVQLVASATDAARSIG